MGKGRRRRSYSDSSGSDSDSEASGLDGDEAGRQSISGSEQDADNWVLCDRCTKWRRIPAVFADQIREDTPWYCENNPNKAFASCSVPQELTNEEIDADEDSEGSDMDEEESLKRRRIPAVWQLLKDNILAHRKRKMQDEDDIMICHCKPVYRGGDGCGPDCINRMLCIECVPGFCPSEEKCTNQMFSKRMYAKLEIRRAGAKGFGLFALEDIKAGQFIIEYIGEVLEEDEYQRRKEYYMSVGQRHYYFMNIGNGEVIDACRKGNISRFINHSCEPNCETQKWLVRGELAIGLFAVRDIPKETELTFDYNFERYGDKPMRCYCGSTNCRKFIGGMQDNFDVSLLPAVEPDNASTDLPPVMLTDGDMDPNMRMLLEWRVGTKVDKAKEMGMVTRLERICKARNVNWSVSQFFGQEPAAAPPRQEPERQQQQQRPAAAPEAVARSAEKSAAAADMAATPAPARAKQLRKAEKVAAGAGAEGSVGKAKGTEASAAKERSEGAAPATGVAKLRIEVGAGSGTPAAGSAPGSATSAQANRQTPATTPAVTPEVTQVRGPKALFKQWKIMQQQDTTPPAAEEKPAATPSSPPSPRSPHSPPSPHAPPSPRSVRSIDNDDAALDEVRTAAATAAQHVPLRKRLRRLPPKPPVPEPEPASASAQNGPSTTAASAAAAAAAAAPAKRAEAAPTATAAPAAVVTSSAGAVVRRNSQGSAGTTPAAATAAGASVSYQPPRSPSPPLTGHGRSRKLRSEIDRRLDDVVGANGRLKDPNRQNVIKVLRLFNLCDIGGHPGRNGFGAAAGGRYLTRNGDDGMGGGMAGPGPGSAAGSGGVSARQRARMADLSLLLDVVLKTTSSAAKKEFVTCGLLTQLHQAMGRNTGKEYCVILRKVLRVVEGLPIDANDVYAVRSAHGNFADMLRQLSSNADYDVRTKAAALLKKFPPSAVTDQRLLQLMAAPPVRFGHGRGGGGGMGPSGMGPSGMRMGPFHGNNMMPMAMQQQYLQQQQMLQQQLFKQQQMLRLKEGAAASSGLPPPPPLGSVATTASGEGNGCDAQAATGAPTLPRSSSVTSLEEELMDGDLASHGSASLPPLGPSRQRAMVAAAAAAALAARPGLLRPLASRPGGMGGVLANGLGPMGLGMGGSGAGRGGGMHMGMGAAPSPLGLPPRPPSPANADAYVGYNGSAAADDHNPSKRRKHSHPYGLDSPAHGDAPSGPLPGPPPRPPYSLMGGLHGRRHSNHSGGDGGAGEREPPGPPPLGSDQQLPPPPPHPMYAFHHGGSSRSFMERDRDQLADLPERLSVEQLFAMQRPLVRPPPLPQLQGQLQPERHLHGELTDVSTLFALGLYGSYRRSNSATALASAAVEPDEQRPSSSGQDAACCKSPRECRTAVPLSPLLELPPLSPLLEPPPPPSLTAAAAGTSAGEAPPPPPGDTASMDGIQLRPVRTHSAAVLAPPSGAATTGPSPYHQQSSPAPYAGWGAAAAGTGSAAVGAGSASSTPTVSGLAAAQQQGGFAAPTMAPTSAATANATAPPPVVPVISSLSDWRMPPSTGAEAAGAAATASGVPVVPASHGLPLSSAARASPHTSPEHNPGARGGAGGQAEETENIDEWLCPASSHHADVWEEPDASFEAYVADMVRHRLGKYMQPEHPSRVSVQEATILRAKVYREVVAKERRAWEERRSAGVYKPIERHKLEANLKEFVRSTIKRMRDREKEKAAAAPGHHGGGGGGGTARGGHAMGGGAGHGQHRQSLSYSVTPPSVAHVSSLPGRTPSQSMDGGVPRMMSVTGDTPRGVATRLAPSPGPDASGAAAGAGAGTPVPGYASYEGRQGQEGKPAAAVAGGPDGVGTAASGGCGGGGSGATGDVTMAEAMAA